MELNIVNYLSNMDQNSKFLLVIIAIISVLLILIFIFNFLSNRKVNSINKRKKANKKKLIREIEEASKNIVAPKKKERVRETVKETAKVPVQEVKVEPTIQVSNVVKEDEPEIIEILQDEDESDVDRILREIKEASKEETMNLTQFEKEQEETAIISYDELCKRAGVKKKIYKSSDEIEAVPQVAEVKEESKQKYKPSKIVSPIFGVQEEKKEAKSFINIKEENDVDLDQTFLQNLKEFRSGLE